jgi:hypothetical protein
MKNSFAPFGAALSVLAFLGWMIYAARTDPRASEAVGSQPASVSSSSNDEPLLRERTAGSAVPCAVPLGWHIARVDDSFGLSSEAARAALSRAATLWVEAVGADLFSNDPDGELSVRLVYDDRQEERRRVRRLELEYNEASARLEARWAGLEEMSQRNDEARSQNRAAVRDLDRRVGALNDSIRDWNARDDAPAEVGERLRTSASMLDADRDELTARAREIDELARQLKDELDRLDDEVVAHRSEAEAIFGPSPAGDPESGVYREAVHVQDGAVASVTREIRIHRFDGTADLVLLAAHELGHALGLAHNTVRGGIMQAEFSMTALREGVPRVQPGDVESLLSLCPDL